MIAGGSPTVVSGSAITARGRSEEWRSVRLVPVAGSVMTAPVDSSEPVPAVVGTATTGAAAGKVRARGPPKASRAMRPGAAASGAPPATGAVTAAHSATALPASIAAPPPMAHTPSAPSAR